MTRSSYRTQRDAARPRPDTHTRSVGQRASADESPRGVRSGEDLPAARGELPVIRKKPPRLRGCSAYNADYWENAISENRAEPQRGHAAAVSSAPRALVWSPGRWRAGTIPERLATRRPYKVKNRPIRNGEPISRGAKLSVWTVGPPRRLHQGPFTRHDWWIGPPILWKQYFTLRRAGSLINRR